MVCQVDSSIARMNENPNYDITSRIYGDLFSEFAEELNFESFYANEEQVISKINELNRPTFTIFNLNCRSLQSCFTEICTSMNNYRNNGIEPAILSIQESWLSSNSNLNLIQLQGYELFSKPRPIGKGGGVAFYIQSKFKVVEMFPNFFEQSIFECLILKISYKNFKAIVISLYRTPGEDNVQLFFEKLLDLFDRLDDLTCPIFLLGDMNLNLYQSVVSGSSASQFLDNLIIYGYINVVLRSTRIQNHSHSLLDLICCKNFIQNLALSMIVPTDYSDHFLTVATFFEDNFKKPKKDQNFTKRLLSDENYDNFCNALNNTDWSVVTDVEDVDLAYEIFLKKYISLYDVHCPKVVIRNNKNKVPQEPYINNHILKCKQFKNTLYKIKINDPSETNKARYNAYRNEYFRSIRRAKKIYYQNKIKDAGRDGRKLWGVFREVLGVKKHTKEMDYLEINDTRITDKQEIANQFNTFFGNLGTNLTPSIPTTIRNFREFLPPRIDDSIFIGPLSLQKTFELITSIKPKDSQDYYGISMKLICRTAGPITAPLQHIYNLSINRGIFPDLMKISKVVLVYKNGPISLVEAYRGVSMIASFSKPLERYIYSSVYDFLDERQFFSSRQFGFRRRFNTSHNVLNLMNLVAKAFIDNQVCSILLLDIKKAFDLVDRDILLAKLYHYGIRGNVLNWFRSYFSGRKQKVFFGGVYSSSLVEILIGILQGSCLGVLMFLVFINDLESSCRDAIFNLFCDDTLCFLKSDNFINLIQKLNEVLPKANDWYAANKLIINSLKTKIILFKTPRQNISENELNLIADFPVFINTNNHGEDVADKIIKLDRIDEDSDDENNRWAKHLGIRLDPKLKFTYHWGEIHRRLQRAIFSLRVMKHVLDMQHLKMLYFAYIHSIIEYSIIIFTGVTDGQCNIIKKLQKKCVRIITNSSSTANSSPLFKQLRILPFKELRDFHIMLFMHKYLHGQQPDIFDGTWQYRHQLHQYNTRNREDLNVDVTTKNYIFKLPLIQFPLIFNSLPEELKSIQDFKLFKKRTFNYLLNNIE